MSLARAFTTRLAKQPSVDMGSPQRGHTVARARAGSIRNKISGPVGLTHTTNMLAYNAPDLYPKSVASTTSKSDDDSDSATNISSPPTSPEVGTTPERVESPEPNHLSCYFTTPNQKAQATTSAAPIIPTRAASHTKKASMDNLASHVNTRLSHQSSTSISTKSSAALSRSASVSTTGTSVSTGSTTLKSSPSLKLPSQSTAPASTYSPGRSSSGAAKRRTAERLEPLHPFGQELAQVSEIAEEFGIRDKIQIIDEEEEELKSKGLFKFQAEDYVSEVQGLFSTFFQSETKAAPKAAPQPIWI